MHPPLLALTIGAMVLGAALLAFAVVRLIRLLRESVVATLPALAGQSVEFKHAGTFILHVEQPRFTSVRRGSYALRDASHGEVKSWPILVRTVRSGFGSVRFPVRGFAVDRPGRYELSIAGIDPEVDLSKVQLVLMRPFGAAMVLLILGIILGAAGMIGGLVFTALHLSGKLHG